MYLNLDLLYNVDKYIFLLFYCKRIINSTTYKTVYSPITKKSITYVYNTFVFLDYSTLNIKYKNDQTVYKFHQCQNFKRFKYIEKNKCKPFLFSKKDLNFLKSNKRIFLKKI